jgi:hypothetical protein
MTVLIRLSYSGFYSITIVRNVNVQSERVFSDILAEDRVEQETKSRMNNNSIFLNIINLYTLTPTFRNEQKMLRDAVKNYSLLYA